MNVKNSRQGRHFGTEMILLRWSVLIVVLYGGFPLQIQSEENDTLEKVEGMEVLPFVTMANG
jgi:hypothetical protein